MDQQARPHLRLVADSETAAPDPPKPRSQFALRLAISAIGASQIALGLAQIAGLPLVDIVNGGHLGNESAAWNAAIGTALLGIAHAGRCSSSVFIMLTAFLGVLTVGTISDLLDGHVAATRIATHLLALTGLLMVIPLRRKDPGH